MRDSVKAAWPATCKRFEGRLSTMYLDTKGLVTTGTGNLIDTVKAAQALPWLTKDGKAATAAQVEAEWKQIKARQSIKGQGGYAYIKYATLHLAEDTIDRLLFAVTDKFWSTLKNTVKDLESFPADAQLALMDLAWQNGPAFLSTWNDTRKSVLVADFAKTASVLKSSLKASPRTTFRVRLFKNAAAVLRLRLDPDVLWDTKTPTKPAGPVPAPPATPTPTPEVSDVAKVKFRGGWTCSCVATSLPLVEKDMIRRGLIKKNIDIFQLGYRPGGTAASAGTHDEGGCTDVDQYSEAQIKVWREWGWTMQKRVGVGSGTHAHGWPYKCPHLAPDAKSQERDWDRKDAGLVGAGKVVGPWPIQDWKTAMKKRLAEIADEDKQKELELPTTAEVTTAVVKALTTNKDFLHAVAQAVLDEDYVPNTVTANTANEFVAPKTNMAQIGKRVGSIESKIDQLMSRFPVEPPAAA